MNQKALEIAKNMLAMGLSAEQVAKATQLSLEISDYFLYRSIAFCRADCLRFTKDQTVAYCR